ncbi:MAG: carboxylating nicotinate-nucleotide diphosphorylase [Abditibacteriota bacterium]|nr:carboxylating nicotinate-nucleotide diphosphorylase [Abditibacteriota bacterium]MBP5093896.1 carboxylating nicotinate-nucleotide diphosphorylase [Abditibacteriota bacterium]MBP5718129.1 carboxylating nicotinate-nucleotide diphosphorylase [Abditibacteriota bacterium]
MICERFYIEDLVENALSEDVGGGDITTRLTVPHDSRSIATLTAKEAGIVAGMDVVHIVFEKVNAKIKCLSFVPDGNYVKVGDTIAAYEGSTRALLVGERVALNFLQHMSGIATVAYRYTKLVEGTKARVIDTRKTTPGLRILEKYAIRTGGAANHRFGLDDGILIKDNHIEAAGGITEAINAAKAGAPHTLRIEVEVVDLDGLREAIDAGAEAVMLDNMDCDTMREAVKIADGRVILEASGGITEANVAEVAATGVDLISSGALTHSVKALDISLNIKAIK